MSSSLERALVELSDALGHVHPALMFIALATMPLVGLPISPLWIATGLRFGTGYALLFALAALVVNLVLGYKLAHSWLRSLLLRVARVRNWQVPELSRDDEVKIILLLRVTPGIPLAVQNYALGLAGVRFGRYLLLSTPPQFAYALGFVWLGNSLGTSKVWQAGLAVATILGAVLLIDLVRRYLQNATGTKPPGGLA